MSTDVNELEKLADLVVVAHQQKRASRSSVSVEHGAVLISALESARDARLLIPAAQAALVPLVESAETDIERDARLYQIDLIEWQLSRAADLAQKRLDHLATITTQSHVKTEMLRCAADVAYWFEYYAFAIDPRPDAPLSLMPFGLFPIQEQFCDWLHHITYIKRTSGVVEKSRDMGATETALRWMQHQWLFREQFTGLILSLNEDLVDSKKDPGTLFEKLRLQMRLLPQWMLPDDFNLHGDMPYMMLANPVNGAVLQGDAPTPNVGRQRRATFVLADEFAAWANGGYPQHTAVSRTTNTFCAVSSVQGRFNKFADLAHDGRTAKFEMDWREHPWRDSRWYEALPFGYLGTAMTAEQIAQEVDRNYTASQPGKVFKQWEEEYVLITWDELVAYYERFNLGRKFVDEHTGEFRVPNDWSWGRMMDYGQTEGHPWIVTHMATPRENYPLADSRFIFSMHRITPTGASPQEGRQQYKNIEHALKLTRDPDLSQMSHEQCGAGGLAATFLEEFGDYWEAWSTDYNVGIPQMQEWLTPIEKALPNPFRPALMGRARLYCVAPPDEYEFVFDRKNNRYFVTPSKSERGYKGFRAEMPAYHYPPEEMGKPVQKMRPKKIKDDRIDTVRGFATQWGPSVNRMTKQEKQLAQLPAELTPAEVMRHLGQPQFAELYSAQRHELAQIQIREEKEEERERLAWSKVQGKPVTHRRYRGRS